VPLAGKNSASIPIAVQLAALQGASTAAFASLDTNISFVLFIPCIIDNRFMTLNQQKAETCSLDIDVKISHLTFLHVTVHKGPSSK
jgi:hypothetical protein